DVKPDAVGRYASGIGEFDRVLGGGIVPGSAILVGGDPGIGKSTLLLQVGHCLAKAGRKTLYISSEESLGQIKLRADRLGLAGSVGTADPTALGQLQSPKESAGLLVSSLANLDIITNTIEKERPQVVVIDSIQMVYRPDMSASP